MEKLVLIDGNSLINRAFYAMPPLTTKNGEYTNAVYGFMNMFFKILTDIAPEYLAVAFDLKAPTFRHLAYSEYKGTRKPMPEELRPQIPLLKELLRLMNVTVIEQEGIEADDIIGTIAKNTDVLTYIFTGDKDSFQLVDEQTEVHFTKRGITDVEIYTFDNFLEKTGILPKQIIDLKSLMGDSSDNIPGVPGVGEKKALSLVQKYSSLDGVYQNVASLTGKLKEKVVENEALARLSYSLATIKTDCEIDTNYKNMAISLPFSNTARERFLSLEFKSAYLKNSKFFEAFGEGDTKEERAEKVTTPSEKPQLINNLEYNFDHVNCQPINVENLDEFNKTLSNLQRGQKVCCLILDTKDVYFYIDQKEYNIHVRESLLDNGFSLSEILNCFLPVFNSHIKIVTLNKKSLRHLYKNVLNVEINCDIEDFYIMQYLADFVGKEQPIFNVIEKYGCDSTTPALSILKIFYTLKQKLIEQEMEKLYYEVELPLSDVLYQMENNGFKIDYDSLNQTGKKYQIILNTLEGEIREIANEPNLNVNSPKQLGEVLFDKLKLGKGKKNKNGYSTSVDVLEKLEGSSPIIEKILKHRQIQKLYSTYVEGLKPLIDRKEGLIKTSFNQTVTSTGRLSSKEPNLQNIPIREEEGRELRKFFVARDDEHILVGADYSQIELRLLADFSNCPALITAFNEGVDIHSVTASKVFGVNVKDVTSKMRSSAKAVNFGIIYGISEYGLAKNINCTSNEARNLINTYFKEYPEVKEYMNKNVAFAMENGYAITLLGRRRYINEIHSSNYNLRQFGERAAMNMPLQGSSADIIKLAMLGVSKRIQKEKLKSKLILQIHDELIVDALISEKEQIEKILIEEMENAVKLKVPLPVNVGMGKNWFDTK